MKKWDFNYGSFYFLVLVLAKNGKAIGPTAVAMAKEITRMCFWSFFWFADWWLPPVIKLVKALAS